jgi:hypothetical protein
VIDAPYDPAMPGRAVSPIFVGRSDQLGRAQLVLDRAADVESSHLLIAGEAGVGKTRFVRELAGVASDRAFRILRGACVSIGGMGLPYAPIIGALRDDLGAADAAILAALDPRSIAALTCLVPGIAGVTEAGSSAPCPSPASSMRSSASSGSSRRNARCSW